MVKSRIHEKEERPIDEEGIQPYQMKYRWVMLALVWLLYSVFGIVMRSMAPLVTPILKDLGISYSQMGIILGSWPLTYITVAAIGGIIIDKWGIRKSLFVGIVIIGLSAVLRYFVNGFATLFLCVALFGIGGPMISIGAPKVTSVWFSGKGRGTAVGIYMTGPWLGGLIAYSTINSVVMPLTGYSWRLSFLFISLLAFGAALLWWFVARDVKITETEERTSMVKVFRGLISIRNILLILIMGALVLAIDHGFTDWLPKILETGGLPPAIAGFAASIPLLISIPTVLFIPRLVPAHLRARVVILMSLSSAIALLIVTMSSGIPLIVGLLLYGMAECAILPILVLILMDMPEVGSKYMGLAAGMFFSVAQVGGFAGPFINGAIRDLTGSFLLGAGFLAGLALALSIMALFLRSKPATGAKTSP